MAAMFAAAITGLTFFPKIPTPGGGYVHLGDTMIYIAAAFLPTPYAMAAAGIGGCFADLLAGYTIYAPFTIIAKMLLAVAFSNKDDKILSKRNKIAPLSAIITTPAVYFFADIVLFGTGAAISGIIWSLAQATASIILFYALATAFDKMQFKSRLLNKF